MGPVASFEDSCHNDYGVPGYKYSHMGYWSRYLRASGGDASLQKCAEQCDRAGFPCIGFHMYEDGAARHCYVYSQERSFHTTIQDARNKAFIRCKVPSWRNNDQGLSFEHFEEKCDAGPSVSRFRGGVTS
ncbi:unnamed protein product [Effrenium voratum]|uniref:Uncharacterized protein n=1 Tax=Effrenium voratum TaxID=2562239 RepID=A0AA36JCI8_9DINO|nr:unnamed protein product [Effrenium voratum]